MPDASVFAAGIRQLTPEQLRAAVADSLPRDGSLSERIATIEAGLRSLWFRLGVESARRARHSRLTGTISSTIHSAHLRHFIWLGMFWGILAVSVIAVVSTVINILSVMFSMYTGYRPTIEGAASASSSMPGEVLSSARSGGAGEPPRPSNRLADAMVELQRAECALFNLTGSGAFQEN